MAADGKLQAEIERMFFLVGKLQEQTTAMSKQLITLNSKISDSAECTMDLTGKQPAAELEEITSEQEEREQGPVQMESTNQKPTLSEHKEEDLWIINLRKMRKRREEAPGTLGIFEFKRSKKYDWGFLFEYGRLADLSQQLVPSTLDGRKSDETELELLRDPMTNKEGYQQNRQRETDRDLKASDVRNPG